MNGTSINETTFVSQIPNIINEENFIIAAEQGKESALILSDEFCEEQTFPYFSREGKFAYNAPRDISTSHARYFNQRLQSFNQYFASDADCIFFSRSVYEQYHLSSPINFVMRKIKTGTLTAGTVENNMNWTIERFVTSDNSFSFMSSVKGKPAYLKRFLYDVLAVVEQLDMPTYFMTFSCPDLRWEELPYII